LKFEIPKNIFRDLEYFCTWYWHSFWIW